MEIVDRQVYTAAMAAEILHRDVKTIRHWCNRGLIRARRDGGGWLISGRILLAYVENRLVTDPVEPETVCQE